MACGGDPRTDWEGDPLEAAVGVPVVPVIGAACPATSTVLSALKALSKHTCERTYIWMLKTNFCRECAFTKFSGVDLDAYHLLCIQWA